MELISIVFFLLIFLGPLFIRVVPAHSIIIVDRDTHYLKTKRFGFYFFNPVKDKVTTHISTNKLFKSYYNYFETHDGKCFRIEFQATYHATNLDDVVKALASVRRSVDDVLNGSVYWAVNNLTGADVNTNRSLLYNDAHTKILSEFQELCLELDSFNISYVQAVVNTDNIKMFKPHLSSHSDNPIQFS